jgi:hypothetical protein
MRRQLARVLFALVCTACLANVSPADSATGGFFAPVFDHAPTGLLVPASTPTEPETRIVPATSEVELVDLDDTYEPTWTVWVGSIFLTRSNPTSQTLISSGGAEIFNARQFNFGTTAGPDVNVLAHGDVFDVDFRYFNVFDVTARRTIIPGGSAQLEINDPVDLGSDILSQTYNTGLQSVEINARRNVTSHLALLAGFRYVSLNDDLRTRFDLPNDIFPAINFDIDGINRLYGGQIGADAILWDSGRLQLQSALKAGIFGNSASNAARMSVFGDGDFSYGTSRQTTSFVGDVNVTGVVQITDHWSIRGGYQLLWISAVALSTDQFPFVSHHFIPDPDVVTTGDVLFHGALVSVQAAW